MLFASQDTDISELFTIPQGDEEIEESMELVILSVVNTMKESEKAADTATVYLNDLKRFIKLFYRHKAWTLFVQFIDKQISLCKSERKGKGNLNKYADRTDLVDAIAKHYNCSVAKNARDVLESDETNSAASTTDAQNYLISRIIVENIQRSGAVCNMTVAEYSDAIATKGSNGESKRTIVVTEHKTARTSVLPTFI